MREALARVAHVLKTSNLAPHLSYVRVSEGWMSASDGRIYVSAPVDCRLDFCVQGSELQRALDFDDMEMILNEKGLIFKKGRSRITLKTLEAEANFYEVEQPDAWRKVPDGYIDALFRARQFTSENATQAWALGVMNLDDRLVATNNVVLASVDFPNAPIKGVVPSWLIDFLQKMGERPVGCWDTGNEIYLRFEDDSWLRSLRIEGDPPAQMQSFVDNLYERSTDIWEIPADWRVTYRRTLEFSKRDIHVTPTCISAVSETAEVTTDIETPVPHATLWDHKFLGPVLHEADRWDIENCGTVDTPRHTFWCGEGIRGLVCSKRLPGV